MVRLGLALLISLQLSAYAKEKAGPPPVRVVADPVGTYYRERVVNEGMDQDNGLSSFLLTIDADFDCDGKADLAVTSCFETRGKGGTWWSIFLKREDGKYVEVGSVGTKAARFKITPNPKGGGDVAVMLRGGPGNLGVEFYRITQRGLKKTSEEHVLIPEEHVGPTRIDEIFGKGYSEQPTKEIPLAELKKKYSK